MVNAKKPNKKKPHDAATTTTKTTDQQQQSAKCCWSIRKLMPKIRRSTVRKIKKFAVDFGGKFFVILPVVTFTLYLGTKSHYDMYPPPKPFSFLYKILETDICTDQPNMTVVILTHSSPSNTERRNALRRSWANHKLLGSQNTSLLFFMGQSRSPLVNQAVARESELHHDIIQEDYIDSYRNMTYKFMSTLKWTIKFCSHVRYVLKIDDDVFLNIHALAPFLREPETTALLDDRSIFCKTWTNERPVRRRSKNFSKWAVSLREFRAKFYPVYCSGMFVLLSLKNAKKIFEMSKQLPYFWIDDVFMTGIVAAKLKLQHHNLLLVQPYGDPVVHFTQDNIKLLNSYHTDGNYNRIYALWNLYLKKVQLSTSTNSSIENFTVSGNGK